MTYWIINKNFDWAFFLLRFCFITILLTNRAESFRSQVDSDKSFKENDKLWKIITREISISEWINVKNFPKKIPKSILINPFSCVDICGTNELKKKKQISKKCIYSVRELLETTIENKNRKYPFKIKKGVSLHEALVKFCLKVAKIYISNESKICNEEGIKHKNIKNSLSKQHFKFKNNEIFLKKDVLSEKSNVNSENSIKKLLFSVLSDYRNSLSNNQNLISQVRKSKQKQVSLLIKRKDWRNLAILLSKESKEDILSFLDVLMGTDQLNRKIKNDYLEKLKCNLNNNHLEIKENTLPFGSMPTPKDEWNAIIDWIQDNTHKSKSLTNNWMVKRIEESYNSPIMPENFVSSEGIENIFINQCIGGLRSLAYKTHIAPNGDKYYSYNSKNKFGIIIEGRNQHERINSMKNACKIIFNKFYEYLGIKTKKSDDYKFHIDGKLNFLTPLTHDKIFLNKLVKSFYKLINDKKREWQAIVNEARISPLVNSQDLQMEMIPYYFMDENIGREMNLEKKESLLSDKCFETLEKMKDERTPGEPDIPLYNIEVGSEGKISQAKFCKGVFERFITRHIEWLMIVIKSINDPVIKLISIDDPYLDIPDVFLFPEDARLRENCITSLLVMFEKNTQAIENGFPVKVYPQINYLGKPEALIENVTFFCENVNSSENKKIKEIEYSVEEISSYNSNNMNPESKLIELINKTPNQISIMDVGIKIEDRLDRIPYENPNSDVKRLEDWKMHFEEVSSLDSHGNSIIKIFQNQFSEFINYEQNCEKKIKKYIEYRNLNIENNINNIWLQNYLMETDRLKGDWATELQSIEDLQNNISAAEGELESYVRAVRSVIQGDDKQKELLQYKKILKEWPNELSSKERIYIKLKIDNLILKQKHESNIESLRYEQLERRRKFKIDLKNSINEQIQDKPILFDLEYCMRESEDLYPIYPELESIDEEKIRLERIENLNNVSEEFKYRFKLLNRKLNEQLVNLDSVLSKKKKDFLDAWALSYNTALALQLQIRARNLVEEYVRASERYLLIKRVKADYEYRRSIMNEFQTDPSFESMLNRASEMIERAETEEIELKKELSRLSEEKNNLSKIVEQDMENIYSQRLKAIRESKEFLKNRIEHEKKILIIEEKIFEDQLGRDLEYYKIKDISESAIYRAEQLQILYEATSWLLNFNEKLTISSEMQFREDLEKLDYVIPRKNKKEIDSDDSENKFNPEILLSNLRKHKYKYNEGVEPADFLSEQELKKEAGEFYNDDPSQGMIPVEAQTLLRIFKENLILKLNDLDEINQLILRLNLNTVGSFQYFDYNRERAYYSFLELPFKENYSNLFAVILSYFEWEHIQLRWRALQLTKYVLGEKEKVLSEMEEMKMSLDIKMREFNAVPLSRKLVPIGTLAAIDSIMNEVLRGSRTSTEEETLEFVPSNIPSYLLSDEDYYQARQYDHETKKVIFNRIMMVLSESEGKYLELIKDIVDNFNKEKKKNELEIQSIKKNWDELKTTILYKQLSKEEKEKEEQNYKKNINRITESSNLLLLVAKKQILLRKVDKIDLFRKKVQFLFQDPSFTGQKARELEISVAEFYGTNSGQKYDEISPRIKLATELNNLRSIEEQITEFENLLVKNGQEQNVIAKLHKLKLLKEDINEKISNLNKEVEKITEKVQEFQNKHFKLVFEVN